MSLLPKPQPPKQQQIQQLQVSVSNAGVVSTALAAGNITQSQVNSIVAAAINQLRAGE